MREYACNGKTCEDSKMYVAEELAKITEKIERIERSNEDIKTVLREFVPNLKDHPAMQPAKPETKEGIQN